MMRTLVSLGLVMTVLGSTVGIAASAPAQAQEAEPPPAQGWTEEARWWRNPDGSTTAEIAPGPVNFVGQDGRWREIDLDLKLSDDGSSYVAESAPKPGGHDLARLARRSGARSADGRLSAGGYFLRHVGAADVAGVVENGSQLRFPDALPGGRDVILELTTTGLKDTVVVPDASAGASYEIEFTLPDGLEIREVDQGTALEILWSGRVVARYGDGIAFDAAHDDGGEYAEAPVHVELTQYQDDRATVSVSVDEGWFQDPSRVFPVAIDPATTYTWVQYGNPDCPTGTDPADDGYQGCDTYVNSDAPTAAYEHQRELRVGSPNNEEPGTELPNRTRTFIKFQTDSGWVGNGFDVTDAQIRLYNYDGVGGSHEFHLFGMCCGWNGSTTWDNQPGGDNRYAGRDSASATNPYAVTSFDGSEQWVTFRDNPNTGHSLRALTQAWADGAPDYGVRIETQGDERDINAFRKFRPVEWGSSTAPRLTITYWDHPSPARSVSASGGADSATINWQRPTYDGHEIIGYEIRRYTSSGSYIDSMVWDCAPGCSDDPPSATYSRTWNLPNGTYKFRVRARQASGWGDGELSSFSNTVTVGASATRPSPPRNAAATAGDAEATVTWDPPADDGGAAVDQYRIETYRASDNSLAKSNTVSGSARSHTVTGLSNGTSYYFKIYAHNTVGDSDPAQTNTVTPQAATAPPSPPRNAAATAGDAQATITWDPPSDDGGAPVDQYRIETYNAGNDGLVKTNTTSGSARSYTVTGLSNGTSYYFKVYARNSAGDSGAAQTNTVTPRAPNGGGQDEVLWGVDSLGYSDAQSNGGTFFERVEEQYGQVQFYARYLGCLGTDFYGLTRTEAGYLRSEDVPIMLIDADYGPSQSTDGTLQGHRNGADAAEIAIQNATQGRRCDEDDGERAGDGRDLQVPEGTAIFADIEAGAAVDDDWLIGYYTTLSDAGYRVGFYHHPNPAHEFDDAFCGAVARSDIEEALLWPTGGDSQGRAHDRSTREDAPEYDPRPIECGGQVPSPPLAWQYGLAGNCGDTCGYENVDTNLLLDELLPYLWDGTPRSQASSSASAVLEAVRVELSSAAWQLRNAEGTTAEQLELLVRHAQDVTADFLTVLDACNVPAPCVTDAINDYLAVTSATVEAVHDLAIGVIDAQVAAVDQHMFRLRTIALIARAQQQLRAAHVLAATQVEGVAGVLDSWLESVQTALSDAQAALDDLLGDVEECRKTAVGEVCVPVGAPAASIDAIRLDLRTVAALVSGELAETVAAADRLLVLARTISLSADARAVLTDAHSAAQQLVAGVGGETQAAIDRVQRDIDQVLSIIDPCVAESHPGGPSSICLDPSLVELRPLIDDAQAQLGSLVVAADVALEGLIATTDQLLQLILDGLPDPDPVDPPDPGPVDPPDPSGVGDLTLLQPSDCPLIVDGNDATAHETSNLVLTCEIDMQQAHRVRVLRLYWGTYAVPEVNSYCNKSNPYDVPSYPIEHWQVDGSTDGASWSIIAEGSLARDVVEGVIEQQTIASVDAVARYLRVTVDQAECASKPGGLYTLSAFKR